VEVTNGTSCMADTDCNAGTTCNCRRMAGACAEMGVCYPTIRNGPSSNLGLAQQLPRSIVQYYRGGESCTADTDCPFNSSPYGTPASSAQPVFQHCIENPRYSPRPEACGSLPGDRNCVCSNFDSDMTEYSNTMGANKFPVRYLFCTDDRTNDISWCNRFD